MKKNDSSSSVAISRRNFLNAVWATTGTVSVLSLLGVGGSFVHDAITMPQSTTDNIVTLGLLEDFTPDSVTLIRDAGCFVACNRDGGLLALSNKCTHLGCAINWDESKRQFMCPCHASIYDMNGDVICSPAPRALAIFPISISDAVVQANMAVPIRRSSFAPDQLFFAAEG